MVCSENYRQHFWNISNELNKSIGLLHKLQNILLRSPLLTIYKSFIWPHLDFGDIIYDHTFNNSIYCNFEMTQCNAALTIIKAIKGTSKEKSYLELGLETLQQRRWCTKLCCMFLNYLEINYHVTYLNYC